MSGRASPSATTKATALVGCLAALLLVVPAEASRNPTKSERTKIEAALSKQIGDPCGLYPAGTCKVKIRVSTKIETWAAANILPTKGGEGVVQGDVASLKRKTHRWRVHQVGNGGGCDVPSKVKKDLNLFCA